MTTDPSLLSEDSKTPPYLVIFLGASNLARAHTALKANIALSLRPQSVEFLTAMGPGRGYVAKGGFCNVRYTPIGASGIWDAAKKESARGTRTVALITDIGSDIMYGVPAEEIVRCLQALFNQLDSMNAQVIVTLIPLDPERDLNKFYFRILRTLYFPKSKIELKEAAKAVKQVDSFLRESATGKIHPITGLEDFVSMDKIHYSFWNSHKVWRKLAGGMLQAFGVPPARPIKRGEMLRSWMDNARCLFFALLQGTDNRGRSMY